MRIIDADALMEEFAEFVAPANRSDFEPIPTWNDAVSLLGSAPTIAAEPVKHGRWDITGRCSNCGKYCGVRKPDYSYCPNCGAKMSSEVEEETLEMWNLDGSPTRYIKGAKMDEVVE